MAPFGFGGMMLGQDGGLSVYPINTPSSITGLVLWLRADMGVVGNSVSAWNDQSGTGDTNKNCLQATPNAQPTWNKSNASYNGRPTIDFNGTTDYLQSGAWTSALGQPFTSFVIGHSTSATNAIALDNLAAHQTSMQCNSGLFEIYAGSGLNSVSGNWAVPGVATAIFFGILSQLWFNQQTGQSNNQAGANNMTGTTIGGYGASPGNTTNSWTGSIAEIMIYNTSLSAANIDTLQLYAGTQYGITIGA